jgi:CRISPR-associated RAMP protein (TIGR02581 family)
MFDTLQNRLSVAGYLVAESAIRIGTGRTGALTGSELPVIRNVDDQPLIPGSSLKGVLRSHLEAVARGMTPHASDWRQIACDPTTEDAVCLDVTQIRTLKEQYHGDDAGLAAAIQRELCLLCQTFGAPWRASPIRVRDLPVVDEEWFGQFDVRDGVAIDRDKGTVAIGPYDYEVVPAGTRFQLQIEAENLAPWQRGLLWLGIRALERGEIAVGGFVSRGLGWVRLEDVEANFAASKQDLLNVMTGTGRGESPSAEEIKSWVVAFREKLNGKGAQDA